MPSVSTAFSTRGKLTKAQIKKMDPEFRKAMEAEGAERQALMSKDLKLPKLLEKRRQDHGITDGAFAVQPFDDRVFVYQVKEVEETYGKKSMIIRTASAKQREEAQKPMGVLIAAGPKALDELRSNGIDLGHVVMFLRISPWRYETDSIGGKKDTVLIFHSGDITGSVDLATALRSGKMAIEFDKENNEHVYRDTKTGEVYRPQDATPFMPDDM